jgi:hypothetical protein
MTATKQILYKLVEELDINIQIISSQITEIQELIHGKENTTHLGRQ